MKHRNRLGFAAGVVTLLSAGLIMTLPANAETVQQTAAQSGHDIVVDAQGKVTDFTDEYTEAKGPLAGSNPLARSGNTVDVFDIGNSRYTQGDAIDVSSYQDWMTFDDFRRLRSVGVRTVVVKVSEGTGYLNPKAASEIIYARQAGMKVAVYHYAKFRDSGSGWNEGRHMADCLNRLGLPKNVLVFADMEHKTEPGGRISSQIVPALQSFWNALNGSGYRNHAVYTYESYLSELAKFNRGSITSTVGGNRNTWLAQYPFQPYRNCAFERNHRNQGYGAWQFSSTSQLSWKRKVNGWNKYIDLSRDYNGLLTNAASLPVARGQQQIDGHWYYFDANGMKTGFQWIADQKKTVYYGSNGQMQYGQKQINGKWYLFDRSTGAMKTGWQWLADQNKTVYYASNGQMQYGQQQIGGKWYLFDKTTGAMKTGWQWIADQNKEVYYNSKGEMQYGPQKIGGYWYYFNNSSGAMTTGWLTLNGRKYYYDGNGHQVFGEYTINGTKYVFDQATGELKYQSKPNTIVKPVTSDGWKTVNGKTFYYSKGKAVTGQQKIGGKWYLFGSDGVMKTGWQWIADQNKTVYYNSRGEMQYGQQKIGGKWYLFDNGSGAMKTGFQWIANQKKTVYYNSRGEMQYGQQKIGGKWYLFDNGSGAMKTGFQWIANQKKTVYYNSRGEMQYGRQFINGRWYNFNKTTGALMK